MPFGSVMPAEVKTAMNQVSEQVTKWEEPLKPDTVNIYRP
jgi:hypothetical protein